MQSLSNLAAIEDFLSEADPGEYCVYIFAYTETPQCGNFAGFTLEELIDACLDGQCYDVSDPLCITVFPDPQVSISTQDATTVCDGGQIKFTAAASGGLSDDCLLISWQIDPANPQNGAPQLTQPAPLSEAGMLLINGASGNGAVGVNLPPIEGGYVITAVVTCDGAGCTTATSNPVNIVIAPDPQIDIETVPADIREVCYNEPLKIQATTSGGTSDDCLMISWSFVPSDAMANAAFATAPMTLDEAAMLIINGEETAGALNVTLGIDPGWTIEATLTCDGVGCDEASDELTIAIIETNNLIIATNAEVIIPACLNELVYNYRFTVVNGRCNDPNLTPVITNLGYAFTGPVKIDSYVSDDQFTYSTYEIAVTVPAPAIGTTVRDCFTITYEGESLGDGDSGPCFDVTKSGDPKPQIVMNPQTITIPDCQASVDAVFGVTILSCDETASTPTFNFLGANHTPGFSQAGDGYFRYTVNIPISAIGTNVATVSYTDGEGRSTQINFLIKVLGNEQTTDYSNLSCTGQVNIKLNDDCEAYLSATQLLNGAVVCDDLLMYTWCM
ncbi:MAG: hypothetical protein IPJ74_03480 [Saprospiraceae bacterium]|nr:hypothetical protein [Saprospiraceae bacterium]